VPGVLGVGGFLFDDTTPRTAAAADGGAPPAATQNLAMAQAQAQASGPWVSDSLPQRILTYTQIAYPIILTFLYIAVFIVQSIVTARNDNDIASSAQPEQLGPGGKPLPKKNKPEPAAPLDFSKPRKLLFEWLSVGVLASLAANITVVIVHTVLARREEYWCGQAPTVSKGRMLLGSEV
jgi:hypothetical protein